MPVYSVGRFFGQALAAIVLDALAGLLKGIIDLALGDCGAVLKFIGVPEALSVDYGIVNDAGHQERHSRT